MVEGGDWLQPLRSQTARSLPGYDEMGKEHLVALVSRLPAPPRPWLPQPPCGAPAQALYPPVCPRHLAGLPPRLACLL